MPTDQELLAKALVEIGGNKIPPQQIPPAVSKALQEMNPRSSQYKGNELFADFEREYDHFALIQDADRNAPRTIKREMLGVVKNPMIFYGCYKKLCQGILYSVKKHYETQPEAAQTLIEICVAPTIINDRVRKTSVAGVGVREGGGWELIINPQYLWEYAAQSILPNYRYRDVKLPAKEFNAAERTLLTGIEEMTHVYQFERGESTVRGPGYFNERSTYLNDPLEQEAAAIKRTAVEELRLGDEFRRRMR